jgi:hypothetical protein
MLNYPHHSILKVKTLDDAISHVNNLNVSRLIEAERFGRALSFLEIVGVVKTEDGYEVVLREGPVIPKESFKFEVDEWNKT